jgi:hypothetical protein
LCHSAIEELKRAFYFENEVYGERECQTIVLLLKPEALHIAIRRIRFEKTFLI